MVVCHNLQYRVQLDSIGRDARLAVNMIEEPDASDRNKSSRLDRLGDRTLESLI